MIFDPIIYIVFLLSLTSYQAFMFPSVYVRCFHACGRSSSKGTQLLRSISSSSPVFISSGDDKKYDKSRKPKMKKITPRMKRIQANIEVYNARKNNPLLTKIKPLKLPSNFDVHTSSFDDVLRAVTAYERAGQCRSIYSLCQFINKRDNGNMLRMNGGLLFRNIIVSELKLNRNDLAIELLKLFSESCFKDTLICIDNKYSNDLLSFMQLLCKYGDMEAATYMIYKFELMSDKYLKQLIKSREYDGSFEKNIVSSVSAKLSSMSTQLENSEITGKRKKKLVLLIYILSFFDISILP